MSEEYKTLSKEKIYSGRVISLYKDEVEINGVLSSREYVRHNGGAAVLAEKDGKFAFVSQFRHPLGKNVTEIPAGNRDPGEDPLHTAKRELEEECGLSAKRLEPVCSFCVSPGYTDEFIWIYYANEFEDVPVKLDEDEFLQSFWVEKERAFDMLERGEIYDGKTVIALLWYLSAKKGV